MITWVVYSFTCSNIRYLRPNKVLNDRYLVRGMLEVNLLRSYWEFCADFLVSSCTFHLTLLLCTPELDHTFSYLMLFLHNFIRYNYFVCNSFKFTADCKILSSFSTCNLKRPQNQPQLVASVRFGPGVMDVDVDVMPIIDTTSASLHLDFIIQNLNE